MALKYAAVIFAALGLGVPGAATVVVSSSAGALGAVAGAGVAGTGVAGTLAAAGAVPGGGQPGAGVPPTMTALYRAAASTCPGLPWSLLQAIGTVESANGTSTLPGVHSGANPAGAEGPMQFEPATFYAYARPIPPGGAAPPSPYDPVDAVYAAARMLCSDGAAVPGGAAGAVWDYNHSWPYVYEVLAMSSADSAGSPPGGSPPVGATTSPGQVAAAWALEQLGTPYAWGGESAAGFDCSGLVQAAYAAAGVALPRTAQWQWDAGPALPAGTALTPGDLVFFGTLPDTVDHVGIVVGAAGGVAEMVDAPHPGAAVRVEPFPLVVGAAWGGEALVGATAP